MNTKVLGFNLSGFEITEKKHAEFFRKALEEVNKIAVNAGQSVIADSVAINRQLAGYLSESRRVVEEEAILTIDAMSLAFDGKSEKLKALKSATERVAAESAFMKSELATVATKTAEIERLTTAIDALSSSIERFRKNVDDGSLDLASKAASAIYAKGV